MTEQDAIQTLVTVANAARELVVAHDYDEQFANNVVQLDTFLLDHTDLDGDECEAFRLEFYEVCGWCSAFDPTRWVTRMVNEWLVRWGRLIS